MTFIEGFEKQFKFKAKKTNVVVHEYDKSCDMQRVKINNKYIMGGNDWDFHNGCHGMYDIPEFNNANQFISIIKRYFTESGHNYTFESKPYKYED